MSTCEATHVCGLGIPQYPVREIEIPLERQVELEESFVTQNIRGFKSRRFNYMTTEDTETLSSEDKLKREIWLKKYGKDSIGVRPESKMNNIQKFLKELSKSIRPITKS
jgi:hypothetical protein